MLLFKRYVVRKWWSIPESILGALGSLWIIVAIANYFLEEHQFEWYETFKSCSWPGFILIGLVVGIVRLPRLPLAGISGTDVQVGVHVGNIFSCNGAFVVGCNSTFDTSIEDGTISQDSIQGQFTERFCGSIRELDEKLTQQLCNIDNAEPLSDGVKPYGKQSKYSLGTTVPVDSSGKKAYFVAIATLNEHRVASVDEKDFLEALPIMWDEIRSKGGKEDILCPILGSGFARLNLDRGSLIKAIVRSFVAATREGKFTESLTVVIRPRDYRKAKPSLEDLRQFIDCECKHRAAPHATEDSPPSGIPL